MNYAHIRENTVYELIPEFDPVFPGVPIEQRFAPDFLARCEPVDGTIQVGYIKTETGFEAPPEPEPLPEPVPEPELEPASPTDLDKLRADVDYIAMETGVTLDV